MVNLCPKGKEPHRAYRLYFESVSPKTKRATKIPVAAVMCASPRMSLIGERIVGTYVVEEGQHGIVPVDYDTFLVQRRHTARLVTKSHPEWAGRPEPEPKSPRHKAEKASPKARKPKKASQAAPKPKKRPKRRETPTSATAALVEATATAQEAILSPAGQRLVDTATETLARYNGEAPEN